MIQSPDFKRLREFVQEIHGYYLLNHHALSDSLVVSKAMVSFALTGISIADLDILLTRLQGEGFLLAIHGDCLIFPVSFIEGDC